MLRVHGTVMALALIGVMAGCQVKIGPANKGGGAGGDQPGQGSDAGVDSAEEAAVQVVKNHRGDLVFDESKPKHVIGAIISEPSFTDANVKDLAAFTHLKKLRITSPKITGAGFSQLAKLPELTELTAAVNQINDSTVKEIATLTHLKVLDLQATKITDQGINDLAPLKQLEELSVANNMNITNTTGPNIAKTLPQLQRLHIDNTAIGDVGVMRLAPMRNLKYLTLFGTKVEDGGIGALTNSKSLEELYLSGPRVTNKTCAVLVPLQSLRVLHLFNTNVTDACLSELGKLKNLRQLEIRGGVSNEAIAKFIQAHPNVSVK